MKKRREKKTDVENIIQEQNDNFTYGKYCYISNNTDSQLKPSNVPAYKSVLLDTAKQELRANVPQGKALLVHCSTLLNSAQFS